MSTQHDSHTEPTYHHHKTTSAVCFNETEYQKTSLQQNNVLVN